MANLDDYTDEQLEYALKKRSARRVAERLAEGTEYSVDDVLSGRIPASSAAERQLERVRIRRNSIEETLKPLRRELAELEEAELDIKDDQESMTAWRANRWAYR